MTNVAEIDYTGGFDQVAGENETIKEPFLLGDVPLMLINFLLGKNIKLTLTQDQIDAIQGHNDMEILYKVISVRCYLVPMPLMRILNELLGNNPNPKKAVAPKAGPVYLSGMMSGIKEDLSRF